MKPNNVPVAPNQGEAPKRSLLHKLILTPAIFVSFLISLVIVDMRYTIMRSHFHPEDYSTRLPRWLHRLIYSYQPYQYVRVGKDGKPISDHTSHDFFYHSKQKKLMKMEVDDAFQIRRTVLVVLGIFGMVLGWCLWRAATWILWTIGLCR